MLRLLLLAGLVVASVGGVERVRAIDGMAPEIILPAPFVAYENVVKCNDLLLVGRIHLPIGTQEAPAWEQYGVDGVMARLMFDGDTLQDRLPAALGHSMLAFYIEDYPGSFGSASLSVRVQGNVALFVDPNTEEVGVDWTAPGATGSCGQILAQTPSRARAAGLYYLPEA